MTSSISSVAPFDFAFANASWSNLQSPKQTPRASERNSNAYPADPRLSSSGSVISERIEPFQFQNNSDNGSSQTGVNNTNQVEAAWIEQYEPGVYITLVALHDGTRDLRRVRFRLNILLIEIPYFFTIRFDDAKGRHCFFLAAEEDSGNIKLRHGGRRIGKKCTKNIM